MNAGKSTSLLQASYNYQERGMETLVLTPAIDTRSSTGHVSSRIGITTPATIFNNTDNLFHLARDIAATANIHCLLIDEAQFLEKAQVIQLTDVTDELNIPVLCYGLRTDFRGELFPGSKQLLAWADDLTELKTICHCGRKANMVLRLDSAGNVIKQGAQIKIGGDDQYVSVCRQHFKSGMASRRNDELMLEGFDD
jgi:thymidine kinase